MRTANRSAWQGPAIALLVLCVRPVAASSWQPVSRATNGVTAFIDIESPLIHDGLVLFWVKYNLRNDRTTKARLLIMRQEARCADRSIRAVSGTFYAPNDSLLANEDYSASPFHSALPDSIDESLVRAVCANMPKE